MDKAEADMEAIMRRREQASRRRPVKQLCDCASCRLERGQYVPPNVIAQFEEFKSQRAAGVNATEALRQSFWLVSGK